MVLTDVGLTLDQVKTFVQIYWLVPAGVVALYFYGSFHFNTPDYRLVISQSPDQPSLLTLAPPKFTTTRARFRRYSLRYILVLEALFLSFVFLTSVYVDAAKIAHAGDIIKNLQFDSASVQFKALIALFCLTGLLSSFPFFKDIDAWLLRWLHQAALIPDDAKLMASRLFGVNYQPSDKARAKVRQILISRDTIRFAEGGLTGNLERRVVSLLWLYSRLKEKANEAGCEYFAARFEMDLADIAKSLERMKIELVAYFRDQAKLVPEDADDIDHYLSDHMDDQEIAALSLRRDTLQAECDSLYYRTCLLTSVLAYSTESTAEEINDLLLELGFPIKVSANPIMDWDAVFRVVGSVLVLTSVVNIIFMRVLARFGTAGFPIDQTRMLVFAITTTLLYFVVVYLALKVKRYWRRTRAPENRQSENPKIAIMCYLLTLPISIALSLWVRPTHDFSTAPFLFAANQGVVGYFIAMYVDRSLAQRPISWQLAVIQGGCQAIAALLIFFFLPPIPGVTFSAMQNIVFGFIFICQAGISGFLVGAIFQYFYRRTSPTEGQVVGDMTVQMLQPAE